MFGRGVAVYFGPVGTPSLLFPRKKTLIQIDRPLPLQLGADLSVFVDVAMDVDVKVVGIVAFVLRIGEFCAGRDGPHAGGRLGERNDDGAILPCSRFVDMPCGA